MKQTQNNQIIYNPVLWTGFFFGRRGFEYLFFRKWLLVYPARRN